MAPMADVTDRAFREMFVRHSKGCPESVPYVSYTEFVSADGLFKGGFDALEKVLIFSDSERPIVAQFFSPDPVLMGRAAKLARERGFDGIDINMGCPDANVCNQGSGAALIKNAKLARDIIRATQKGAGDIPVSVKTRIGYTKDSELEEWLPELLAEEPAVVILHARTKKNMSKVPARWENIARAVAIRDALKSDTLIIGNGDVRSLALARSRATETNCDGIMIGRGLFGNPWFFREGYVPSLEERLRALVEHAGLFEKLVSHKPFHIMKKHFKAYAEGFHGAKELREELMRTENSKEVARVIERFLLL